MKMVGDKNFYQDHYYHLIFILFYLNSFLFYFRCSEVFSDDVKRAALEEIGQTTVFCGWLAALCVLRPASDSLRVAAS
jgi:hypothetical protein